MQEWAGEDSGLVVLMQTIYGLVGKFAQALLGLAKGLLLPNARLAAPGLALWLRQR
jgi:hypothetical protein